MCQILVLIALQFLNDATSDKLHVALLRSEADKGTGIYQRRAGYAHVHLLHSVGHEFLGTVAELRAAHDAVVAEQHTLVAQHGTVGDEFHLCHERTHFLVGGSETAWPGGGILGDGTMIRFSDTLGITQSHAHARIGDTANAIHRCVVLFTHHATALKAHLLHIAIFIRRGGKSVVNPEERTDLHLLISRTQHFHAVGTEFHDFARTHIMVDVIPQIGKGCAFARCRIGTILFTNNDGCASPLVASGNDAVVGEQQHRTRPLDAAKHILDALNESLALNEQQSDQLGLVGLAR